MHSDWEDKKRAFGGGGLVIAEVNNEARRMRGSLLIGTEKMLPFSHSFREE